MTQKQQAFRSLKIKKFVEKYDNGRIKSKGNYLNGLFHGVRIDRYSNGRLWVKENYVDGVRHGFYESWYGNGQLEVKGNYIDGKPRGVCKMWHENGKLYSKVYYIDGKDVIYKNYQTYQENIQSILNKMIQIKDLAKLTSVFLYLHL